ncbi:MAG: hypothetical protein R6X25_10970 [Candidatus Krumholzibacteriia bacterium]
MRSYLGLLLLLLAGCAVEGNYPPAAPGRFDREFRHAIELHRDDDCRVFRHQERFWFSPEEFRRQAERTREVALSIRSGEGIGLFDSMQRRLRQVEFDMCDEMEAKRHSFCAVGLVARQSVTVHPGAFRLLLANGVERVWVTDQGALLRREIPDEMRVIVYDTSREPVTVSNQEWKLTYDERPLMVWLRVPYEYGGWTLAELEVAPTKLASK